MTEFWLATFQIFDGAKYEAGPVATDAAPAATDAALEPIFETPTRLLAVEVMRDGDELAVLLSQVLDEEIVDGPRRLRCLIGFTNVAKPCNVWMDRGFPLVDAIIVATVVGPTIDLDVRSPFFDQEPTIHYELPLLSMSGVRFEAASSNTLAYRPTYCQELETPDTARPDVEVRRREVMWTPGRTNVAQPAGDEVVLHAEPSRCPSLAPLPFTGKPDGAWSGWLAAGADRQADASKPRRAERGLGFGPPAFRFEDVEVIGFRVDVASTGVDVDRLFAGLVAPLNFHLETDTPGLRPIPDFKFKVASQILLIELLRYGRMKQRTPAPPFTDGDSQSQHELLVRLLVGRVDDDTAQARNPAVYVPAIFVDNPWSKVLGRAQLGFDKRLANFCVVDRNGVPARLLPDGRREGAEAWGTSEKEALGSIARVDLVDTTGTRQPRATTLLELEYDSPNHADPDGLDLIDLDFGLGSAALLGVRWRLDDFILPEFRRAFARLALGESLASFRCLQVAPVSRLEGPDQPAAGALQGIGRDRTWVNGRFLIDYDIRMALPLGTATLRLNEVPTVAGHATASTTPSAWNLLVGALGGSEVRVTTGNWYRLRFSADLIVDDGLAW